MADVKITDLTADANPADGDFVVTVDVSDSSNKKVTRTNFFADPPMGASSVDSEALKCTVAFYASSTQSMAGAQTEVTTWTETFDEGSDFNASTGRFTAPYDGVYHFSGNTGVDNSTGRVYTWIYVDNTTAIGFNMSAGGASNHDPNAGTSVTIELTAGQYVSLQHFHDVLGTVALSNSFFSGHLVGRT